LDVASLTLRYGLETLNSVSSGSPQSLPEKAGRQVDGFQED